MMKYEKVSTKKGKGKRSASIPFDLHHIIQPSIDWKKIESGCHSYPVFAQEPTRIKHMIIQWSNTEALGMYAHLANHRCTVWHSESFCAIWILQVFDVGEWKRHNSYRIERSRNPGGFVWVRVQDPDSCQIQFFQLYNKNSQGYMVTDPQPMDIMAMVSNPIMCVATLSSSRRDK